MLKKEIILNLVQEVVLISVVFTLVSLKKINPKVRCLGKLYLFYSHGDGKVLLVIVFFSFLKFPIFFSNNNNNNNNNGYNALS